MIEQRRSTSQEFVSKELQRLTKELERQVSSGTYPTLDEQMALVNKLKETFFRAIRNTHTAAIMFQQFDILNPVKQATMVRSISWDVSGAYNRIEDTQVDLQTRMNKFAAFKRQVEDRVSRANGVVQGTAVLNDIGVFEIGDTFNDLNRIDQENPSAVPAMFQSRLGGILTLPREQADNVVPVQILVMNSSNGFVPDGQELEALQDDNADTWFEYHREAADQNDDTKLTLDLMIKLKLPTIVNLIRISPLILDDKAFPHIETIETSIDGRIYQDIRDSLPSFITKEEEDALFTLGPVGFRNQSAAEFVITPRICQFIKIRIRQSKKTEQTDLTFRQIIAIRDINIQQVQYQERGELLTTALPLPFLAKRVLVSQRAAQTDPLTTIAYQISLDGGATYSPMLVDTPLDINTGTPTSISVDGQKREARLRLTAVRNTENFNGIAAPLASTVKTVSESLPLGQIPLTFSLQTLPVQDTLRIFRPIAAIGKEGTLIGTGGGQDNLTVDMPVAVKPFTETVKINGYAWTRVANFDSSSPGDTHYTIDYNNKQIKFGNNTKGQVPEADIRLEAPAEKIVIPDTSPFEIELDHSHDFNSSNIDVTWTGKPAKISQEILRRGATEHPLAQNNILQSLRVREAVPAGVTSFVLQHIPLDRGALEFDDTIIFASGNWSTIPIISGNQFAPVKVWAGVSTAANNTTDSDFPGYVEYDAVARIVDVRSEYNTELYSSDELEIYRPTFNADAFGTEQGFINGKDELTRAGDYSIDFTNGIAYTFSDTPTEGNASINYYYSPKRDLEWQFGEGSKKIVLDDDSVLVNKNDLSFATTSVVTISGSTETTSTRYFFLFKDNRFIWMPFDEYYMSNPTIEISTAKMGTDDSSTGEQYVVPASKRPLQDTVPQTNFTFVPSDDFIKGFILPTGATRVNLEHDQVVKNSIRFIHLSDDINSFDDRIVTKDSLNNITVAPKPVKDVYGNSLTGSSVGTLTQRDIDGTKLVQEVRFINGKDELLVGGDYTVDYENGILYTFDPIPAYTIVQYEFSDIAVSYVANKELLQGTDFEVDLQALSVTINSLDEALDSPEGSILVRYSVVENFAQDPAKVQRYYTPILYGYKLKVSKG